MQSLPESIVICATFNQPQFYMPGRKTIDYQRIKILSTENIRTVELPTFATLRSPGYTWVKREVRCKTGAIPVAVRNQNRET